MYGLSNAVQLVLSIFLLKSRQISVLKLSLLGTILSSLLLTTGLSFLLGGYNRKEQKFNKSLAQMISALLLLAVSSHAIPTTIRLMMDDYTSDTTQEGLLAVSRGISVIILISYGLWLFFTLLTHRKLYDAAPPKAMDRLRRDHKEREAMQDCATVGAGSAATNGGGLNVKKLSENPDEDHKDNYNEEEAFEQCSLSLAGAAITLVVSVVLLAFNTQFATDSIQAILQRRKLSQTFLSMIILPLLSIDPVAINAAMVDKMDICISLALERCMQTCLLVVPLIVLLAWGMGVDDMNLDFDGFSITTLFVSVLIVTYVVREGKSNW
jgi:Ca2+:H+ antiporter